MRIAEIPGHRKCLSQPRILNNRGDGSHNIASGRRPGGELTR